MPNRLETFEAPLSALVLNISSNKAHGNIQMRDGWTCVLFLIQTFFLASKAALWWMKVACWTENNWGGDQRRRLDFNFDCFAGFFQICRLGFKNSGGFFFFLLHLHLLEVRTKTLSFRHVFFPFSAMVEAGKQAGDTQLEGVSFSIRNT